MTDNICDSWEDVDVDKVVIKQNKTKNNKSAGPILQTPVNSSFHIEDNNAGIIVTNNRTANTTYPTPFSQQASANAFKVLQREPQTNSSQATPPTALLPTPTGILPNPRLYSSVVSSQLSPNATPFEYHPKIVLEDSSRTQFVAPLRILNRPNSKQDQAKDPRSNVDVNKQLLKSFEEKQAEYAKARLRILGEEMKVENLNLNDITESNERTSSNQNTTSTNNNKSQNSSPVTNSGNSTSNNVIILREPLVPDGTKGFRFVR